MYDTFLAAAGTIGVDPRILILAGLAVGTMTVLAGLLVPRLASAGRRQTTTAGAPSLIRTTERDPEGMLKSLVPTERRERSEVRRALARAGFDGPNAVRNFYLLRLILGIVLPVALYLGVLFQASLPLPIGVRATLSSLSQLQILQGFAVLVGIGFYGPGLWLSGRIRERRERIEMGFPNALDLMQVAVESGLGLDAAMMRVAQELRHFAPEISEEFLITQKELQAGRDRDRALLDMAERLGIDEAGAFSNVVLQSSRFGTNLSTALMVYADEMRVRREIRAQEKANKLPVQMSAVMACLMLPALFMVTLGPVVIRYVNYFGN
ncbi:MAG: type II secretion system F family protein [Gemmobacter sp.]